MNDKRKQVLKDVLESNPFYDPAFPNLDLSGFPHLQEPPPDPNLIDDRFAPPDDPYEVASKGLKDFLANPDEQALQDVARQTGNPELVEHLRDQREGAEAEAFVAAHPDYYPTDANYNTMREYVSEHKMEFNRKNLAKAFKALTASGDLEFRPQAIRPLSEEELLEVSNIAQMGLHDNGVSLGGSPVNDAIGLYLQYGTGGKEMRPFELLDDPKYRPLTDKAVWFCWEHARSDYSPTAERRAFMKKYMAGRRATVELLNQAWLACQREEKSTFRSSLLSQVETKETASPEEIAATFDQMNDEELEHTLHATLRARADEIRKGR